MDRRDPRPQRWLLQHQVLAVRRRRGWASRWPPAGRWPRSTRRRSSSPATRPAPRSPRSAGRRSTQLGHEAALAHIVDWLKTTHGERYRLAAVGHRVVHGGPEHAAPVRVDAAMVAQLERLVPLAPLHQPHNLAPIRALLERSPALPQVACFDTAFHRSNPAVAQMFALPMELTEAGVRRYGFHGLSYEYIASVLPRFDPRAAQGRTVVLHLGNGASMCALQAGRSVASTMGFTAVDGLPMGTRSGALDPGVILYLMDERRMDARAVEKLLYQQSGLLGVSGVSSDMRDAARVRRAPREARRRALRLSHRARARLARRRARRPRCHRLHRRHRRARRADPRARVPAGGVARRRARPAGQRRAAARASAAPRAGSPPG